MKKKKPTEVEKLLTLIVYLRHEVGQGDERIDRLLTKYPHQWYAIIPPYWDTKLFRQYRSHIRKLLGLHAIFVSPDATEPMVVVTPHNYIDISKLHESEE